MSIFKLLREPEAQLTVMQAQTSRNVYLGTLFHRAFLCSVLFLILIGCNQEPAIVVSKENKGNVRAESSYENKELNPNELKIIKKVIDDFYFDKEKGVIFLVNQSMSEPDTLQNDLSTFAKQHKKELKETTFANFIKINSGKINFNELTCVLPRCHLFDESETNKIFENDEQRVIMKRKYSTLEGAVRISRVGFDNEATQAIVYREKFSGPKSGLGEVIILEKISDDWVISKRVNIWIS